jgi:hypothetical protein
VAYTNESQVIHYPQTPSPFQKARMLQNLIRTDAFVVPQLPDLGKNTDE